MRRLKQEERKRLTEEKQRHKAEQQAIKQAEKQRKHEQIAHMRLMKKRGIEEKQRKAFAEARERRLKKLGIKVRKEKKNGSWIFHLDKSGYKRKEGLFKKREPVVKYKSGSVKKATSKKSSFWSDTFGHLGKPKRKSRKKKSLLSKLKW